MENKNYIFAYYQAITDGSIVVGKWVRLVYEYIVKGLHDKLFFYEPKKAISAILFVEKFVHHHEGVLAPQLIKLELWQKAFLSVLFGIVDVDGNRQFREVLLVIGRKNGKTLFAAAIAEYCTFLDGEYGGRIYFTAPKLQQADLCFNAYFQSIKQEPELLAMVKKRRTDVYIDSTNTSAMPLAFSNKKSDGLNISVAVCDEVAAWGGDPGLKFYEVLKSSVGARKQPLILNITTAGYENDGIYDELIKRSTRFLLGDSRETRLFPVIYAIDDIDKWNDINELQKANPNLNVSITVDYLLEEIAIAEGSLSKKGEFITKYCCLKQNSSLAWLPANIVEKASGEPLRLEDFRNCYCVGGIDLSMSTDLTSCCVVIEKDGELYVFSKFFLPSEKMDEATARDSLPYNTYIARGLLKESGENFMDYKDCFNWFRSLVEQYQIFPLMVGYDRYSAQYLVQDMKEYGFHMDDVYQGDNLWPVIQETEGLMRDGKIHIGDNDLLKVHLLESAVKMNTERGRGRLVKIHPTGHIDGTAALLDAMCVRQKWAAEFGARLKNQR